MSSRTDGFEPSAYTIPPPRPGPSRSSAANLDRGVSLGNCATSPRSWFASWLAVTQSGYCVPVTKAETETGDVRVSTRVVVAEDEVLIRLDLVEMLTEEGYEVVGEAGDGEAAVALALELKPDLVVMDVKMPKLDGITAAEQIATSRIAPVVMLTAFSQRDLVDRARQAGAMAYVVKPFGKADIIPAIEIARARFAEIQAVEAEVSDLTERLESRKAVDRAKGLLQTGLGLTEPEAFRWIQKTAMDLRKSMREVAEGVIEHGSAGKKK
jgi:AmiR/NasT family two-component response regulator